MTWVVDCFAVGEVPQEKSELVAMSLHYSERPFRATPEPAEPREPTVEEMLESGYLRDDISLSYDLQMTARRASDLFDVPYAVLISVMYKESRFVVDAVNYDETCFGLMQIHRINFQWVQEALAEYGVEDIQNDPEDNILAGAYMLKDLLEKYGDWHKVLMAYNCGEAGARKLWDAGHESSEYSREVLEYAAGF